MDYGVIYKITNNISGKLYIGQTCNFTKRIKYHKYNYYRTTNIGKSKLYDNMKKYGWDSFTFDIIDNAKNREELDNLEINYIKLYDTMLNGLNMRPGGKGSVGHKMSDITKEKMRISRNKRGKYTKETCDKISEGLKGHKISEESKKKMSLAKIGKPSWKKGKKGKPLTDEQKRKISESLKNRKNKSCA